MKGAKKKEINILTARFAQFENILVNIVFLLIINNKTWVINYEITGIMRLMFLHKDPSFFWP